MQKYIKYVNEFHQGNKNEIDFINNQLTKHLIDNDENQTEIEHILDFLYSTGKEYKKIGYSTIVKKAEKRNIKLMQNVDTSDEIQGEDYEIVKEYEEGFRIVKLLSEKSYKREGKLMSHCVASYYGRDTDIYSLRDKKNNPHATLQSGEQVKGKGNGSIHPKYVKYVVEFLESQGMKVRESEMKNLGYYKLDNIDQGLTCDTTYNGYVYEGDIERIKDNKGNKYLGFGIFNIKKLVDIRCDFSLKFNFDISSMIRYVMGKLDKKEEGNRSTSANTGYRSTSANTGDYSTSANTGYRSTSANTGDYSTSANTGDYSTSANTGYRSTSANTGDYSTSANTGDRSISIVKGKNSVAINIGKQGKASGVIGSWLVIAEYNKENIHKLHTVKVDGQIIKENTLYKAEAGKLIETE